MLRRDVSPLFSILGAMFLLSIANTSTLLEGWNSQTKFATTDVLAGLWTYTASKILPVAAGLAIVGAIGLAAGSRRKGPGYRTGVYDRERRVWWWVGEDRTEAAVQPFFPKEIGPRRCHPWPGVARDRGARYANLVRQSVKHANCTFGTGAKKSCSRRTTNFRVVA
jgi:hypothetical protein